ncbi:MAG TPA: hypothetical protein VMH39_15995, partial [Gemmatimonadaceae bacterium]|nr:hypothetical protein [Gemmatimonadaceae bacterium]
MSRRIPRLLRAFAILLAVAGAVDPAITSERQSRPVVSVVAADSDAAPLAGAVARQLAAGFTVIPAPFAGGAAATVLVGDRLPASTAELAAPAFAVVPAPSGAAVAVERVEAPASAPYQARTAILASARATGAAGRTLEVALHLGGVVIDRVRRRVATNDEVDRVALTFVPMATGAVPLRVTAAIDSLPPTAAADVLVSVSETRRAVLFYDPRPSWMSTFVRRAIEGDPRFAITSRVVTSRNASTDAGQPPASLDDLATLDLYDVIVVGAPESLSARDVAGLDAFMRRHGGGVVLLLDEKASGPYETLAAVRDWAGTTSGIPIPVDPVVPDGRLRSDEITWPDRLPAGAEAVARSVPRSGDTLKSRPVIWRSAVGAGRLVVSGALDAWRTRDSTASAFDEFWRSTIAATADAAAPAVG